MTSSYTRSQSATFSRTSAKHVASKVAADLKLMQLYYGQPSDADISKYEEELVEYLVNGYLSNVKYGFRKAEQWIPPVLSYSAATDGTLQTDDNSGRIPRGCDVSGAVFYSYLEQSSKWSALSSSAKESFKGTLPITRTGAPVPAVGSGSWGYDRSYARDGGGVSRSSLR